MLCRLVHVSSSMQPIYPLRDGITTIGRDLDNDIQLPSEHVSRHHARICNLSESCAIEDMGSTNGVLVNGELQTSCLLKDGDKIQIGKEIFLFEITKHDETDDAFTERRFSSDLQVPTVRMKWRQEPTVKKSSILHKDVNKKASPLKRKK